MHKVFGGTPIIVKHGKFCLLIDRCEAFLQSMSGVCADYIGKVEGKQKVKMTTYSYVSSETIEKALGKKTDDIAYQKIMLLLDRPRLEKPNTRLTPVEERMEDNGI